MSGNTNDKIKKNTRTVKHDNGRWGSRKARKEDRAKKVSGKGTTLKMPLAWHKNTESNSIKFAYNALQRKPSLRSRYIAKAVTHYKEAQGTVEEKHILFNLRGIKCVQLEFNIKTLQDLKNFFDTVDLDRLKEDLPEIEVPRMMLCGFTEENEELAEIYWQLMAMDVNERLEYISNAIYYYVADGFDFPELRADALHMLVNWIERYRTGNIETKTSVLEMFVRLGDFEESVRDVKEMFNEPADTDFSEKTILASESEMDSFLK
jgi:hypothetical protein